MKVIMNKLNKKIYYIFVWIVIAIMISGLLFDNPRFGEFGVVYLSHSILVFILSVCLLLYPKNGTAILRLTIIIVASVYFYTLFLFYPDTWSTFIFLCFIPALSILFFDSKLFYFSLVLNTILITIIFGFILLIDRGLQYPYIVEDPIGNFINFI